MPINLLVLIASLTIFRYLSSKIYNGKFTFGKNKIFSNVLHKDPINQLKIYHSQRLRNDIAGKQVYRQEERNYVINLRTHYQDTARYLLDLGSTEKDHTLSKEELDRRYRVQLFHTSMFTDDALAWYGLKFIDRQRGIISLIDI